MKDINYNTVMIIALFLMFVCLVAAHKHTGVRTRARLDRLESIHLIPGCVDTDRGFLIDRRKASTMERCRSPVQIAELRTSSCLRRAIARPANPMNRRR